MSFNATSIYTDVTHIKAVGETTGDIIAHDGTSFNRVQAGSTGAVLETQSTVTTPIWAVTGGKHYEVIKDPLPSANTYISRLSCFTATKWLCSNSTSSQYTTDGGATWNVINIGNADGMALFPNSLNGVLPDINGATAGMDITTDGGATTTAPTTPPPQCTTTCLASMGSGTVAVCSGVPSAGTGLWYSNDAGDHWTQVATPVAGTFYPICMFNATVGCTVDSASNVWVTTDGGQTWTDTTLNVTTVPTNTASIMAIDSTHYVYCSDVQGAVTVGVELLDTATPSTTTVLWKYCAENRSHFFKTASYVCMCNDYEILYTEDGLTWYSTPTPYNKITDGNIPYLVGVIPNTNTVIMGGQNIVYKFSIP